LTLLALTLLLSGALLTLALLDLLPAFLSGQALLSLLSGLARLTLLALALALLLPGALLTLALLDLLL
jgi:uncharacterized membrane protein YjjP (DUF1212 family)